MKKKSRMHHNTDTDSGGGGGGGGANSNNNNTITRSHTGVWTNETNIEHGGGGAEDRKSCAVSRQSEIIDITAAGRVEAHFPPNFHPPLFPHGPPPPMYLHMEFMHVSCQIMFTCACLHAFTSLQLSLYLSVSSLLCVCVDCLKEGVCVCRSSFLCPLWPLSLSAFPMWKGPGRRDFEV